jgi:transcriptional regulator with XRE-family HTH domain
MNKAELARQLGVSRAYVTMMCNGTKKPSQEMLTRIESLGAGHLVNKVVNRPNDPGRKWASTDSPLGLRRPLLHPLSYRDTP